jgi:tetratricopeptide (TPR) repeat protein
MRQDSRRQAGQSAFRKLFDGQGLHAHWEELHRGDREPYPDAARVGRLGRKHAPFGAWLDAHGGAGEVAAGLQDAWREFHAGQYARAIALGDRLGALGATAANKAAAIQSLQQGQSASALLKQLEAATVRGEQAVETMPDYANAHYMLALVLGRYSQRISITRALAAGLATRVRTQLEATLRLEPRHAEAHIALGLYHAEIVAKLGSLLAGLGYQASGDAALKHFQRAIKLVPESPVAHIEYANGLLLLNAAANRDEAGRLYERAAACQPLDAMEQLDVARAQRGPV